MERWDSWRKWFDKTGKRCVRVIEKGDEGERAFHFHFVTDQWWSVVEVREVGERYGFGRINVKAIPIHAADYLAKYAGKSAGARSWLPRGMRQWGCVGFKGVVSKALKWRETVRVVVANTHHEQLYSVLRWVVGDAVLFQTRLRPAHEGADVIRTMELKPAQVKDITSKLASGEVCAVGEFRGVQVRSQKMEDPKTKQFVDRVLVEFNVELGGLSRTVTRWTEPGTQAQAVKLPALTRGEIVLVVVETIRWFKGSKSISGDVRPLATLV